MEKLRNRFLNVRLDAVLHPASLAARQAATEQKAAAERAQTVTQEEVKKQHLSERLVNATRNIFQALLHK